MRARAKQGSVVLDKRSRTWNFFYWQDRKRHSKTVGTLKDLPTKAAAWRAAKSLRDAVEQQTTMDTRSSIPTVGSLIEEYQAEKMPTRKDTRRGYESWIRIHILPKCGESGGT
jgi:hypothetical protein